jgi:hypothetical protein
MGHQTLLNSEKELPQNLHSYAMLDSPTLLIEELLKEEVATTVTSPMTATIRILVCSKCDTILLTFFSDRT